jgi:beta-xylosidase
MNAYPWIPDQGDGTYRNPVLHADYSDPDVIRHGEDFWMVASSFTATPGLPILHSRDLVNWTIRNHAIRNVPHPRYRDVQPGCGVWAPAIRFHAGKFWVFFPMPDEGIFVTCADDPAGIWSEPWCLQEAKGWIDPCPFWDDDGQAYLVHAYANSRAGKKERLHIRPMAPDGTRLLGEGREVIHTPHHAYLEGPKVHKLNGWYYILAPGGGVPTGWQVAFRSRNLFGPYEEKVVLEQGSTPINGPHQGALIDLPNGEWWFMHFQDTGPFGRIVHLQPVQWNEGWPLMGVDYDGNGVGEPVPAWRKPGVAVAAAIAVPQTTDEFDAPRLGLQWQWQANHEPSWGSLAARPGWLRLFAQPSFGADLGRTPALMMQKFQARSFAVETLLDFQSLQSAESAGLAVVGGGDHASLAVSEGNLVLQINGQPELIAVAPSGPVRLRVAVAGDATCTFSFAAASGSFTLITPAFQAKQGGWMGAKVGLFCLTSQREASGRYADFDYYRIL